MNNAISFNAPLDDETKEHIANALRMRTFEPEKIEEDVAVKLKDAKNSAKSFGTRMTRTLIGSLRTRNPITQVISCVIPLSSLYVMNSRLIKLM